MIEWSYVLIILGLTLDIIGIIILVDLLRRYYSKKLDRSILKGIEKLGNNSSNENWDVGNEIRRISIILLAMLAKDKISFGYWAGIVCLIIGTGIQIIGNVIQWMSL